MEGPKGPLCRFGKHAKSRRHASNSVPCPHSCIISSQAAKRIILAELHIEFPVPTRASPVLRLCALMSP